jgi:hypothetical protein
VIFFSRSEDYILSARQSSAALYADNSADKMSVSVRVGPWQKNRYYQKYLEIIGEAVKIFQPTEKTK